MVYVDTSAWYASVVPDDPDHVAAREWLRANTEPLLTTDYIIEETLTLLRARGQSHRAAALGSRLFQGLVAEVHYLTQSEVQQAWEIFVGFSDKEWSFTDCTSRVVMVARQVQAAFAFDHHFAQFGVATVVP